MRVRCTIAIESLLARHDGALPADEAAALRRHAESGCSACAEILALPDALATPPAPSAEALASVRALARLLPRSEPRPGLVRHIAHAVAPPARPALALRGARTLQRLFETDAHLLTLWDDPDEGDGRYLIGQVYARTGGPLVPREVLLLGVDAPPRVAETDGSEFHLSAVAPGPYLLRCALDTAEIYLPRIVVGR